MLPTSNLVCYKHYCDNRHRAIIALYLGSSLFCMGRSLGMKLGL